MAKKKSKDSETTTTRQITSYNCPFCRQQHEKNECCPLINERIISMKPAVLLWGNIVLECIRKGISPISILEQVYYIEDMYRLNEPVFMGMGYHIDIGLYVNYFANILSCPISSFFVKPTDTVNEYLKLLEENFDVDVHDGKIIARYFTTEIELEPEKLSQKLHRHFYSPAHRVTITLTEYKTEYGEFRYCLDIDASVNACKHIRDYENQIYYDTRPSKEQIDTVIEDVLSEYHGGEYVLADEANGILKETFDKLVPWDTYTEYTPYSDERLEVWCKKIRSASERNLIDWAGVHHGCCASYHGYYGTYELHVIHDSEKSTNTKDIDILGIMLSSKSGICFGRTDSDAVIQPQQCEIIQELISAIEADKERMNKIRRHQVSLHIPEKAVEYSSVIVAAKSLIRYNLDTSITPYWGLVPLWSNDNKEITYRVYLGYDSSSKEFYMFENDLRTMLECGKPLCQVIFSDGKLYYPNMKKFGSRDESTLYAMGYNVDSKKNLSTEERHRILCEAIESGIMSANDILNLLQWLTNTRMNPKFQNATRKWREDIEFIKHYALNNAGKVFVSQIKA